MAYIIGNRKQKTFFPVTIEDYVVSERKRTFWKSARTIFSLPIDNFRIRDPVFATNKVFSHII